jgi:hypothetical protein
MHRLANFLCKAAGTTLEALEARLVMSAPTAVVSSVSTSATEMTIVVKYTASGGVDLTSIGNGDLKINAAAKVSGVTPLPAFSELARLTGAPVLAGDGTVTARYAVTARGGAWDWADNGVYTIALQANQVRSKLAEWNAAATLKGQSLWFTTPHAEVYSATLGNLSQWLIGVKYTDDLGVDRSTIGGGDLKVLGPGGTVSVARLAYTSGSGTSVTAYYYAKVAQNSASWMDRGAYTFALQGSQVRDTAGNAAPAYTLGASAYTSDRPSAVLASSSFSGSAWTVSIRYQGEFGIDLSSVGNGDIQYSGAQGVVSASLVSVAVAGDGSVLARYSMAAPAGGWDPTPGAYTLSMKASQVYEKLLRPGQPTRLSVLSGYFVNGANMATGPAESAVNATTTQVVLSAKTSAKTWEVTVRFTDSNGINSDSVLSGQPLLVYGPKLGAGLGVFKSPVTVIAASLEGPTSWRVTYRLTSSTALAAGSYYLRTSSFQVTDALGNLMPSVEVLAFAI